MKWTMPGTVLEMDRGDAPAMADRFGAMFLAGGISLGQVCELTGLEPHTVQNWVKRGFLTPPVNKRYSLRQLCRILNINSLRSVLPMEKICGLLTYVNGKLSDESDDMIDDSQLYFMFVGLAARLRELYDPQEQEKILEDAMADYREPVAGAKERVKKVLQVMLTGWLAVRMRQETEAMLNQLQ